jgi:hypothetical protein
LSNNLLRRILTKEEKQKAGSVSNETISKETLREFVLIPCSYCSGLMPQTSVFCPNLWSKKKRLKM